jgi:single-strand DNA-binding protein
MLQGFMVGRLGKDAEVKYTKAGDPVCSFSIACESGFGDRAKTLWVDCSLWGERGKKLAEYLLKGNQIAVQGELGVRAWNSDRDHEAHANLQLTVEKVTLLSNGKKPQAA